MSIIEKAVDKLEKMTAISKKYSGKEQDVDGSDIQPVEDFKAEQNTPQEEQIEVDPAVADRSDAKSAPKAKAKAKDKDKDKDKDKEAKTIELPLARIESLGMVSPNQPKSKIAEEYRVVKRPLLMNIRGEGASEVENANLILVSSAVSGEGKTFSAVNLALSIAMEQDTTVLFVDADVSKATATRFLGIADNQQGLVDVLQNSDIAVSDVLLHTNIPNLRILPAGRAHDRTTELLASDNMRRVMLELSRRYSDRVIVFDSPPLLQTTEASVLANLVGQVVLVVAANETPQAAVTEAIQHIREDKVIGTLLNKSRKKD
ncbi:MAG: XrtA-associated tyrosine autokinase, partial [Gammaproteobacteria bacterium]